MTSQTVDVTRRGAVTLVTLNRPDASNTLDMQMAKDLLAAAMSCSRNAVARAIVLTGAGRNFCFGGDLRGMAAEADDTGAYLRELTTSLHEAISHFMRMDAPVIAAVNGTAAGAGVGLIGMADLAVCAASSRFNLAYTSVGLTPDASASYTLPRSIGAKRAMELALLNRVLSAEEALSWGLVNRVVPDAQVVPEAMAMAERLAAGPPGALGRTKRLMMHSLGALEAQMALESETIAAQGATREGAEGIMSFLEKRAPDFG